MIENNNKEELMCINDDCENNLDIEIKKNSEDNFNEISITINPSNNKQYDQNNANAMGQDLVKNNSNNIESLDLQIRTNIIIKLKYDFAIFFNKQNDPERVTQDDLASLINQISLTQIKKFCSKKKKYLDIKLIWKYINL